MATGPPLWRRLLPWAVSTAALGYVLGYAADWEQLIEATRGANLPLFILYTTLDKLIFFVWWGILQAAAVRRFVTPVPRREVIALRGGAELLRTVNGPLADAGFLYGLSQLTGGSLAALIAAAGVPLVCHFLVLLAQASLALPFLEGGAAANRDVVIIVAVGWSIFAAVSAAIWLGYWNRLVAAPRFAWLSNVGLRTLAPFLGWFALFAAFDVFIQGLASRAFGITIDWWALAARIPILYVVLSLPSFGNYGTRELVWAASFSEFGSQAELFAYAFATNTLFLLLHVVIGVAFLPYALRIVSDMRRARRAGEPLTLPVIRDASDP